MGRIMAWTPSLTGGIVAVRDPCLHGRFSIGSLCVGPSDTMSWSPTIGLLITPLEPIQPRLGGRVQRLPNTFRTEVVVICVREVALPLASAAEVNSSAWAATSRYGQSLLSTISSRVLGSFRSHVSGTGTGPGNAP